MPLVITSPMQGISWLTESIFTLIWTHSFMSDDLTFNGLLALLNWELLFSKARDSIVCLALEFCIILFTAEVNLCK